MSLGAPPRFRDSCCRSRLRCYWPLTCCKPGHVAAARLPGADMSPLNNTLVAEAGASSRGVPAAGAPAVGLQHTNTIRAPAATLETLWVRRLLLLAAFLFLEIGRASCRDRVCPYVLN